MATEEITVEEDIIVNMFRDSFPIIFAPREYAVGSPFAIVRSKNKTIIANIYSYNYPRVRRLLSKKNRFLVNVDLIDALGYPESISIETIDPSRSLFVYGTLLSKYWNPHIGRLYNGWCNLLHKESMIRGIIRGMEAVWPEDWMYPFGIMRDNRIVLGEIYFNLELEDFIYLDNIESGYRRRRVKVFPAENAPNCAPLNIWVYEYKRDIEGYSADTYRYGDAYYLKDEREYVYFEFSEDLYVKWIIGNTPIILTCPHGGNLRPDSIPIYEDKSSDTRTFEITEALIREIYELSNGNILPSAVLCRVHRNRVDLNRSYKPYHPRAIEIYDTFHSVLLRIINKLRQEYGKVMILDIHGMKDNKEEIILGTNYGNSVGEVIGWYREIRSALEEEFILSVDEPGYTGFHITQEYGSLRNVGVVQIEIARRIRTDNDLSHKFIHKIAKSILNLYMDDM